MAKTSSQPAGVSRDGSGTSEAPPAASARVERIVAAAWSSVLRLEHADPDDDFFSLGGDSMRAIELLAALEPQLGLRLSLADLFAHPTLRGLCEVVREGSSWPFETILPVRINGSRPPLLFVHGDARAIAGCFPADQPLYRIGFLPNRRFVPSGTVPEVAARYLDELTQIQPTGPYWLCGFSVGGAIAFEMAYALERRGERVAYLALVDPTRPARLRAPSARLRRIGLLLRAQKFSKLAWIDVLRRVVRLVRYRLSAGYVQVAVPILQGLGRPVPAGVLRRHHWRAFRSMLAGYDYETIRCPTWVYLPSVDDTTYEAQVDAWREHLIGPARFERVDGVGHHLGLFGAELAARLIRSIEQARDGAPSGET